MFETLELQKLAIKQLVEMMPDSVGSFEGSDYSLPVKTTFLANENIDMNALKHSLLSKQDGDVKDLIEPILLAAELYEATRQDRANYFISDEALQGHVFMGSKWTAGWVLVLGGNAEDELTIKLKDYGFIVFTDCPNIADTVFIGSRVTSPIYFLQMMVRYGLIWGRIAPGDDHEMGHYLERDMPGFIIIQKDLEPLKYLVALGLMKLGAPAVVPPTFPFPYGNRVVAESIDEIMKRGTSFSNLRKRFYKDEIITLPEYCNMAFAAEKLKNTIRIGGVENSFFCLRTSKTATRKTEVIGDWNKKVKGQIGVIIEISQEDLSEDMAYVVELAALKSINYIQGIKAYETDYIFRFEVTEGAEFDVQKIFGAIYYGIRLQYPKLENIDIKIIFEQSIVNEMVADIKKYKKDRRNFVNNMTEENTEVFGACTECRPFSLVHTCIILPDRLPMCASRTYLSVKAGALFGSGDIPYKRRSEEELPLRHLFNKGKLIDIKKGEYEGCNDIYTKMTEGKLNRVQLHSLRDYPLTSCGCFQNLAFWIEGVSGIGIMSRGSRAVTPDGQTWAMLANKAGGKQNPGIVGVSLNYIKSAKFLSGDGGKGNVVWMNQELHDKLAALFTKGQKIATEKEAKSMIELKKYISK